MARDGSARGTERERSKTATNAVHIADYLIKNLEKIKEGEKKT